jgi:hypothetical protein
MAITSSTTFDAAIAAAQHFGVTKPSITAKGAGITHSLWKSAGFPIAGVNPPVGAGHIPDKTIAGALPFTLSGGQSAYLSKFTPVSTVAGTFFIGDRLWACSGLNGTLATTQAINGASVTRNPTGLGNQLWLEIYAPTGATAANLTVIYTAASGPNRTAVIAMPLSPVAAQMQLIPLQDNGIISVQSATLNISTGTAGDFGLTIVNPIDMASCPSANIQSAPRGAYDTGIPEIHPDACLFFSVLASGSTTGLLQTQTSIARG